jgi:hypothetical protein
LHSTGWIAIGLKSFGDVGFGFFGKGIIFESLTEGGTAPSVIIWLKNLVRDDKNWGFSKQTPSIRRLIPIVSQEEDEQFFVRNQAEVISFCVRHRKVNDIPSGMKYSRGFLEISAGN